MARRHDDRSIFSTVSPDEYALLLKMVEAEECGTVSNLIRLAINSLAMESGDESVFLEARHRGRPKTEAA